MLPVNCPVCNTEFKPLSKKMVGNCSGLWCPRCFKFFLAPEIIVPKIQKDKDPERYSLENRYIRLSSSATRRGIELALSSEEFFLWWRGCPDICHYCGGSLSDIIYLHNKFLKTKLSSYFSSPHLTVDRKDSNQGYLISNIEKACLTCNLIKGPLMTEQEALSLCPGIIQRFKSLLL